MVIQPELSQMQQRMQQAIKLGWRMQGLTGDNPAVGCVITDQQDNLIAATATGIAGSPHAEAIALGQAGTASNGAILYTTLEPCRHVGKNPPCCDLIIKAGIKLVVIACQDPDPRIAGQGISQLLKSGIKVQLGIAASKAADQLSGYLANRQLQTPVFNLKMALTLDGKSALPISQRTLISNALSQQYVHQLRSQHDAIMVGSNTLAHDDPELNCRFPHPFAAQVCNPAIIILDRKLTFLRAFQTGKGLKLFSSSSTRYLFFDQQLQAQAAEMTNDTDQILIGSYQSQSVSDNRIRLFPVACDKQGFNLTKLAHSLAKLHINRVLIEGGATLAASLLNNGLIDKGYFFLAGKTFGSLALPALAQLGNPLLWQRLAIRFFDNDLLLTYQTTRNVYRDYQAKRQNYNTETA